MQKKPFLRNAATSVLGLALVLAGATFVAAADPAAKPADASKKKSAQPAPSAGKDGTPVFTNKSLDILALCCAALDQLGVAHCRPRWDQVSVARREAVAALDVWVGPKT